MSISLCLLGVNLIKCTPRGNPRKRKVLFGHTARNTEAVVCLFVCLVLEPNGDTYN